MMKNIVVISFVGGLLLMSAGLPDSAAVTQEDFHRAPTEGNLRARDAVAAPSLLATPPEVTDVLQPETVLGLLAKASPQRLPSTLPDFSAYRDVPTKKSHFFGYLLPLVQTENVRITAIRLRLSYIYDHVRWHRQISAEDQAWLAEVTAEFRIPESEPTETDFWAAIFERVDAVPEDLVLAQAANESAWGTSRFAREGNNLFGQWCFSQDCGIVPTGRPAGATYEVARYGSVSESIGSYIHNLNTGRTYQLLREIRARMRQENEEPDAAELAAGLMDYSERGIAYVNELRAMIRHNATIIDELRAGGETDGNS